MTLRGGGSRARKKSRRLPMTPAAIRTARQKASGFDMSESSRESRYGTFSTPTKHKILARSIRSDAKNKCVYFIEKTVAKKRSGRSFIREQGRYEVSSICHGGRFHTVHRSYKTKAEAAAALRRRVK